MDRGIVHVISSSHKANVGIVSVDRPLNVGGHAPGQ
jgi:hypothetical protein